MKIRIDCDAEQMEAETRITLTNTGNQDLAMVPILLYRLMKVTSVTGPDGARLTGT